MTNGYKPAPLDLSHVKLTPNQNQLVEKLAENGHNVWARDRVRQGWTYSIVQVIMICLKSIILQLFFIIINQTVLRSFKNMQIQPIREVLRDEETQTCFHSSVMMFLEICHYNFLEFVYFMLIYFLFRFIFSKSL